MVEDIVLLDLLEGVDTVILLLGLLQIGSLPFLLHLLGSQKVEVVPLLGQALDEDVGIDLLGEGLEPLEDIGGKDRLHEAFLLLRELRAVHGLIIYHLGTFPSGKMLQ